MSLSQQDRCLADGVFVTSKKRAYTEYVFDIDKDENGNLCKRKPGRRGPLNYSTIRSIEAVKQEGGACWRCKMLKKPCDGGSPCRQCSNKNSTLWHIGCRRGNLDLLLEDKFPYMPGLGSNEWFLPTKNGEFLQIRVKCDDPAVEVRDLDLSSLWVAPESHSTDLLLLRGFLQQFHDMNSRLKYHYEPCTEHFITQCAKIQWDMLSKTSLPLSKLPESASFIAMTLRALAYAQKYSSVVYQIDFSEPEHHFSQPKTIQGDNFSIEVWRCLLVPEPVSSQLGQINGEQLSSLIRDIVRITQRVLLKRHPTDWPYLLCVLGLLRVIASDLSAFTIWIDPFSETLFPFQSVLSMLCQMYQICTKGNHPLVDGGTWEGYASIAGNDQLAVAHFRSLKEIWMECLEEGCSHDDFDEKMTYLIFGEK